VRRGQFSNDGACGTLTEVGAPLLRDLVRARAAFLVTGGTGSGKTTLLATMLSLVDARERIVIVEDSSELRPDHPHVVGLEGRPENVEKAGAVTVRDLVRQAMRMRPDRLVVGEVRGAEAPRSSVTHVDGGVRGLVVGFAASRPVGVGGRGFTLRACLRAAYVERRTRTAAHFVSSVVRRLLLDARRAGS